MPGTRFALSHQIDIAAAASASFVVRPNRSLPAAGLVSLFALLSAVPLVIAIGFALAGIWMVLPFAALEIAFLGVLTWLLYHHIDDCELIVIEAERVRVRKRSGARESQHDFPRYWARVTLERHRESRYPSRLRLGSHGRYIDLATDVNETDRRNLAFELRHALEQRSDRRRARTPASMHRSQISGDQHARRS